MSTPGAGRTSTPVLAEVVRSGFVEGCHHGSVVLTGPDGAVAWSLGVVDRPMLPRSANKPMQTLGMLRAGLDLPPDLLALATSSHSGEPVHLDGVRRMLTGAGLTESHLRTPAGHPLDEQARDDRVRAGGQREPIAMNCSGKHAAMLASCVARGWPTAGYLDPGHPVQRIIADAVAELAGEPIGAVAVDGCGAPLLALSLAGLARAFGRMATAAPGTDAARVADAVRAYPELVSGTRRDEAALMRATPGLLCKGGAEGVYAAGLPDGRGVAVKICDGAARARQVVLVAALARVGVDNEEVRRQRELPVLGGGRSVGTVRAVLD
ncbi:MAG: asparaginase [Pseudonocardia sp.]